MTSNRWSDGAKAWFKVGLAGLLVLSLSLAFHSYAPAMGEFAFVSGLLLGLSIVLNGVAIYKLAESGIPRQ